jgi:hypothetical protein
MTDEKFISGVIWRKRRGGRRKVMVWIAHAWYVQREPLLSSSRIGGDTCHVTRVIPKVRSP